MQQGSSIKDFDILNKLGEGSFSTVYKVKRISDGKFYAMKKVKMSGLSEKERENALNEIRILASLSSPYIIQYKDTIIDTDSNLLCVIMEFATGGDVTKVVDSGKIKGGVEESEIWRALVQMTLGLKNLHDLKILHRDLKCANVFVSESPEGKIYKLGDLNISKVTQQGAAKTQAGTPYYAAPEVWKGEIYKSSCDIWSLGCIIYEMAASRPPFRANDLQGLNQKIQRGVYDPIPSKYSKDLVNVITQMLKVIPSQRPTCLQILENPIVMKNSGSLFVRADVSNNNQDKLLQTIKVPRNLQLLKGNLPKAKYDDQVGYGRASSAGPKRLPEQTPQPEKTKINNPHPVPQLNNIPNQVQQQQQIKPPVSNRPPVSAKPPVQTKDQQLQQKLQQMEQRYVAPLQTPQSNRNSNPRLQSPSRQQQQNYQYQLYQQKPAAGQPSGLGRRQYSAQIVGKR